MFSFHKPKVYRSTQGCCICKAKSSSSRFTDSKKYETDFIECFKLETPRQGEICNACVLLVKRFKRLPPGSDRNWGHVVDARVGPGLKSMSKFKKRREEALLLELNGGTVTEKTQSGCFGVSAASSSTSANAAGSRTLTNSSSMSEKFGKIFKKTKKKRAAIPVQIPNDGSSDENSWPPSPASCYSDEVKDSKFDYEVRKQSQLNGVQRTVAGGIISKKYRRKSANPMKNRSEIEASFIDTDKWHMVNTCCGPTYEHKEMNARLVDVNMRVPCAKHSGATPTAAANNTTVTTSTKSAINHTVTLNADGLVRRINNATNSIINAQIKPSATNHFLATNGTSSNGTATVADIPKYACNITGGSGTALKKHQLYSRRVNAIQPILVQHIDKTERGESTTTTSNNGLKPLAASVIAANNTTIVLKDPPSSYTGKQGHYLHKLKSDSCKIMKQSIDKISTSSMKILSSSDFNMKNLVKICGDKSVKLRALSDKSGGDQQQVVVVLNGDVKVKENGSTDGNSTGVKFSDNSSDSGYEEPPVGDSSSVNGGHPQKLSKHVLIRPPLMVNGIKVQVQPQNLLLAAKLAGVSQSSSQAELPTILQDLLR